ncbi:MAG: hypothetical protein U0163_00090 [Gemmatimonadaceae bacterium]
MLSLRILLASILLVPGVPMHAQDSTRLPVWPVFSRADEGLNVMLECRNTSTAQVTSTNLGIDLRIDGARPDDGTNGVAGGIGGSGIVHTYPPGARWRVLVGLRPPGLGMRVLAFDADVRVAKAAVISPGRHTLEVRCADQWTEHLTFYWAPSQ